MIAIADASTIADDWRGWAFVAAVLVIGFAVTVILALVAAPHNVPVMGDELSNLDRYDRPHKTGCAVPTCNTSPTVHVYASREWWTFCIEHGTPYLTEELTS